MDLGSAAYQFLVLWLIYVSYLLLRRFTAGGQTQTLAAVLSVFAAVDVPIVYMSIRWWRTQHPSPVFFGGPDTGIDPRMWPAIFEPGGMVLLGRAAGCTSIPIGTQAPEGGAGIRTARSGIEFGNNAMSGALDMPLNCRSWK